MDNVKVDTIIVAPMAGPMVYMDFVCQHNIIRVAIIEQHDGFSAMFSAAQTLPDGFWPRPHTSGLATLRSVEEWAIAAAVDCGATISPIYAPSFAA